MKDVTVETFDFQEVGNLCTALITCIGSGIVEDEKLEDFTQLLARLVLSRLKMRGHDVDPEVVREETDKMVEMYRQARHESK